MSARTNLSVMSARTGSGVMHARTNLGVMSVRTNPGVVNARTHPCSGFRHTAPWRRGSPLLAAADGRQGHLSRPALTGRRGFPGPASTGPARTGGPEFPATPHSTPVPTPAHPTPRAIRVLRSPR